MVCRSAGCGHPVVERARRKASSWRPFGQGIVPLIFAPTLKSVHTMQDGELVTPMWVKAPFLALCLVLDVLYDGKPIQVGVETFAIRVVAASVAVLKRHH